MAPFLGAAVGAALAMPWGSAFVVFTSIALGLSTPYLLLSIFPKKPKFSFLRFGRVILRNIDGSH